MFCTALCSSPFFRADLTDRYPPPTVSKRTVEFMGMHVSYPQYVRLRAIQREGEEGIHSPIFHPMRCSKGC